MPNISLEGKFPARLNACLLSVVISFVSWHSGGPHPTQAVSQPAAAGKSYTVVDKLGDIPTQETWDEIFAKL